jgi:hypothetical protein
MSEDELQRERTFAHEHGAASPVAAGDWSAGKGTWVRVAVAWTLVGIPMLWAVWRTLVAATALFA